MISLLHESLQHILYRFPVVSLTLFTFRASYMYHEPFFCFGVVMYWIALTSCKVSVHSGFDYDLKMQEMAS